MLLTKSELKILGGNHFSKLFDTGVVKGYDYFLFHKIFKNFDDEIVFISTNENLNPVYKLTFHSNQKLKEFFKLGNGYIKILFKNNEAYLYLNRNNIVKLGKDVVLVENLARDLFSDDVIDENRCYYLMNIYKDDGSYKKKSFLRIEFFKPGFFYLQDFNAHKFEKENLCGSCGGCNEKYELKCSDIINLINSEKPMYEGNFDIKGNELSAKFSPEEIKIIKFISYLYETNEKSFIRIMYYLKKNITCNIVTSIHRD